MAFGSAHRRISAGSGGGKKKVERPEGRYEVDPADAAD
jgi:hypothetical protein